MGQSIPKKESKRIYAEDEIVQDDTFSYKGYQVVRGEFFAHLYEPSLCFNRSKVYVNTGCLKRMQDVDYVQILVNAEEKKKKLPESLCFPPNGRTSSVFRWKNTASSCRSIYSMVIRCSVLRTIKSR